MPWPRGLPQGDIDMTNEALACIEIDSPLSAQVWDPTTLRRRSALRSSGPTPAGVATHG